MVVDDGSDISQVHAASIFNPEDGENMYLWNISTTVHNHIVQQSKNSININN
jgi:hypothetical protein